MENWLEHDGGRCPVASETLVRIKPRNGTEDQGPAGDYEWHWQNYKPEESHWQITHYRVIQ